MSFVHLHCHSEYSLLDGANRIDDLIKRALEFEQPALAITDHGNLHAAWEFQEKARKFKLKPIIGMEAYVAPGDRRTRGRPAPGVKPPKLRHAPATLRVFASLYTPPAMRMSFVVSVFALEVDGWNTLPVST